VSDKLALVLVSRDRGVLEMALVYARNAIAKAWIPDIKLYFFGPSEITIATDPGLRDLVTDIIAQGTVPHACIWCSDKYNVSDKLRELGCVVEGIGSPVSEAIRAGYTPMTW
jgi:hypothetical protein